MKFIISSAGDDIVSGQSVSTGVSTNMSRVQGPPRPLPLCLAPKAQRSAWAWGTAPGFVLPRSVSA